MSGKTSVTVTLSLEQWNIVGVALDELPRKVSNEVYGLIATQIADQTKPTDEVSKTIEQA